MSRPRLLFISPRFLFPLDEGGKIRTTGILRAMRGGSFEITLVSPQPPDVARHAGSLDGICDTFVGWPAHNRGLLGRLVALAGQLPVSVASDWSAAGSGAVARALAAGTDVVVVDFPHAAVLLPESSGRAFSDVHPQCRNGDLRTARCGGQRIQEAGVAA